MEGERKSALANGRKSTWRTEEPRWQLSSAWPPVLAFSSTLPLKQKSSSPGGLLRVSVDVRVCVYARAKKTCESRHPE